MFGVSLSLLATLGCGTPPPPERTTPSTTTDPTEPVEEERPEELCQVDLTCAGNILDEPKAPCTLLITDSAGAVYDGRAGVELRGRSSLWFEKPQYAVELRDHSELPLWPGSSWKFLDDGEDAGAAWHEPGFDDSGWSEGHAPLGFGEDYLQTNVDPGVSVTTYFRTEFALADLDQITRVELGRKSSDGSVVWLNGVEVERDHLPVDSAWDTPATTPVTPSDWVTSDPDPALLVNGTNVVAVEVHRAAVDTLGMRFDLYLEATGDDAPTDLFGMGKEADWILNGQYVDRSLFRNRLSYDLFQSFGGKDRYATETRFCEMRLNDEYVGVYTLGEKLDRDDDRIDIGAGDVPGDTFVVKLDDRDGFHPNAVGYGTWQMVYPDDDGSSEERVSAWLTGWEDAILGADPADPVDGIFAWLDMDSAVDWVLLNELAENHDAYLLSVHLWKDQTGKMYLAPWDLDLSMGYPVDHCGADGWVARTFLDPAGTVQPIPFVQAMAEVPAFHEALVARWSELRQGSLANQAILDRIAGYDAILAPAIDANFERWPIEDITFSTPYVDDWLCPVSSYAEEHDRTVAFLEARLTWMDQNIESF